MARYTGPVCKLCRRFQEKLMLKGDRCLTPKCAVDRRKKRTTGRRRRVSDRGLQLLQKQKTRYTYGVLERQFHRFFVQSQRQAGITGENLLVLLERRLDNVVYRLGFADSRAQARQLVQHGHFMLNGRRSDIPSRLVKEGDTISWNNSSIKTEFYIQLTKTIEAKSVASWLSLDRQSLVGHITSLPTPDEVSTTLDSKAVVEYYSR